MTGRIPVSAIVAGAANIKGGVNPPFTADDFKEKYPQFWGIDGNPLVPQAVMDMYIAFADRDRKSVV